MHTEQQNIKRSILVLFIAVFKQNRQFQNPYDQWQMENCCYSYHYYDCCSSITVIFVLQTKKASSKERPSPQHHTWSVSPDMRSGTQAAGMLRRSLVKRKKWLAGTEMPLVPTLAVHGITVKRWRSFGRDPTTRFLGPTRGQQRSFLGWSSKYMSLFGGV